MARAVLVGIVSCVLLVMGAPAADAGDPDLGRVWAKDKVMRAGCHSYKYQYKVTPPESDWSLETFLIGPHGKELAAGQMLFNSDPDRGSSHFRVCRATTHFGKFKIKGKITYGQESEEHWVQPGYFRMRRP